MALHMKKHARYYLIANKIIYDTNLQTINDLSRQNSSRLLTSAAACFICLLEEKGKIVSRKALMHTGWEQHGFIVTTNTLNQNILLIRKAIAQITDEPILKTIFRQGITIPDEFSVISFETKNALDTYINDHYHKEVVTHSEEKMTSGMPENSEQPDVSLDTEKKKSNISEFHYSPGNKTASINYYSHSYNKQFKYHSLINIIVIPLVLIIIFFTAMFSLMDYYKKDTAGDYLPLVSYQKIATTDRFFVYSNSDKCPADYVLPFIEQHHQDFENTRARNLYISCEKNINRVSVFLCDKDVNDPTAECSSFYYL